MVVWISLVISIISITVACLTFYFSYLRPADIELTLTGLSNITNSRPSGSWSGLWPTAIELYYKVDISNLGSKTGIFEGLKVNNIEIFDTFNLVSANEIYVMEGMDYKLAGERLVMRAKDVEPICMKLTFSPKIPEHERNETNKEKFLDLWKELESKSIHIEIKYFVKQGQFKILGIKRNLNNISKELSIENVNESLKGVFAEKLDFYAHKKPHKVWSDVARKCLGE